MGSPNSPRTRQKLGNVLKLEKRDLSYADLHSEVTKNLDNMPPTSSRLHQKQCGSTKFKNDELVKHMSKLPSYLERGESLQDKALNVGVLNWGSLERWHYNHNQMTDRSSRSSQSSSNTSSFFSTEGSSNLSSRDHSGQLADRKMRRPSLQSHLNASPSEGHSQCVKSSLVNTGKFQDLKAAKSNPFKGRQRTNSTYQSFDKNPSDIKLKEYRKKDSDPLNIPEKKTSRSLENSGEISSSKGKTKVQDGEFKKEPVKLQDSYYNNVHHGCPETVVLLLPRDDPGNSHSSLSHCFDSKEINGRKPRKSGRRSFSEGSDLKEVYHKELYSDIPHSCPLPCEADSITHSKINQSSSIDTKSVEFASDPPEPSSSSKISISPSRSKILEERKSTITPTKPTLMKSSKGSDMKVGSAADTKARNQSPTRRLIISMGMMGKSSNSKDTAAVMQSTSKQVPANFGAERAEASACSDNSTNDKPNTTGKARSSPLRRLLDPLLKSKAADSHQLVDPSHKGSRLTNIDEKHGSSRVQALLQVAIKNGLPLFTFAVDNSNDVLAATVRSLSSSRKDDNAWIYTFFTIREKKKKKGSWLNQGGKGHSYIPNVVAQMKVSDPSFGRVNSTDQFSIREFVLFAVDLRPLDQQTSDLQSNDELAAIVVKLPRKTIRGLKQDVKQSYDVDDLSAIGTKDHFSTTVILPGGIHGLPSKGEPSPLIERWTSGGSCDCGGWDLGCRVRILANRTQPSIKPSLTEAHEHIGRFELFSQGEVVEENRPVFSFSSFKSGIFSVEFNSALSFVQAFSICIAVLDSRKPSEFSEFMTNLSEEKFSEKTTLSESDRLNTVPNQVQVQVEGPTRYASNRPHSPVERV